MNPQNPNFPVNPQPPHQYPPNIPPRQLSPQQIPPQPAYPPNPQIPPQPNPYHQNPPGPSFAPPVSPNPPLPNRNQNFSPQTPSPYPPNPYQAQPPLPPQPNQPHPLPPYNPAAFKEEKTGRTKKVFSMIASIIVLLLIAGWFAVRTGLIKVNLPADFDMQNLSYEVIDDSTLNAEFSFVSESSKILTVDCEFIDTSTETVLKKSSYSIPTEGKTYTERVTVDSSDKYRGAMGDTELALECEQK